MAGYKKTDEKKKGNTGEHGFDNKQLDGKKTFKKVSGLIAALAGVVTILSFILPSNEARQQTERYIEFLIDASSEMNDLVKDGVTKWDITESSIKTIITYDIAQSDKVALRTFGGKCEDKKSNSRLILPFGKWDEHEIMSKIRAVKPDGENAIESGILQLTEDFKDVEHINTVDKRVIAFIGSAPECSGRAKTIVQKRLKGRYEFDLVLIGHKLSETEKYQLYDFSKAHFIDHVLYSNTEGQLTEVVSQALNFNEQELSNAVVENHKDNIEYDIMKLLGSKGVFFIELYLDDAIYDLIAIDVKCNKRTRENAIEILPKKALDFDLTIYSNAQINGSFVVTLPGAIVKACQYKRRFDIQSHEKFFGSNRRFVFGYGLNNISVAYVNASSSESYSGEVMFDLDGKDITVSVLSKLFLTKDRTGYSKQVLNHSYEYKIGEEISTIYLGWVNNEFEGVNSESFSKRAKALFSQEYKTEITVGISEH